MSGWGTTSAGGVSPDIMHKVKVPMVSHQECKENYTASNEYVGPNEFCAGKPGIDSCQGDSGGPVVWTDGPERRAIVVGVVSWGIGCGSPGFAGVYAGVAYYLNWIKSVTEGTYIITKYLNSACSVLPVRSGFLH